MITGVGAEIVALVLLAAVLAFAMAQPRGLPKATIAVPAAALAALLEVNIGPNLTYVGSLATLLWRRILVGSNIAAVTPTLREFVKPGALTVPLCLVVGVRRADPVAGLDARTRMAGMTITPPPGP